MVSESQRNVQPAYFETGAENLHGLQPALKSKDKQRVVWVDILRVFVILWIICMHGGYMGGGWKNIGKLFSCPTVFIFFFFSGVLLKNAASAWKRGLLILAVFAFWGGALKLAVFPLTRYVAALIRGETATFTWGVLDSSFFQQYLFLDLGKLWPLPGYMWFMRALGIFTLLSPIVARLNRWFILILGISFDVWGIFLVDHGPLTQDGLWFYCKR